MNDAREQVILVNENDIQIGLADKLSTHRRGALHRAFSVFVFNNKKELLLQQRAAVKYHAANLWANTCCGHPRSGESVCDAAHRRLREELGFDCKLKEVFSFVYKIKLDKEMWEHEFLHVFIGIHNGEDGKICPDPNEVQALRWTNIAAVKRELEESPKIFAPWFPLSFEKAARAFASEKI